MKYNDCPDIYFYENSENRKGDQSRSADKNDRRNNPGNFFTAERVIEIFKGRVVEVQNYNELKKRSSSHKHPQTHWHLQNNPTEQAPHFI